MGQPWYKLATGKGKIINSQEKPKMTVRIIIVGFLQFWDPLFDFEAKFSPPKVLVKICVWSLSSSFETMDFFLYMITALCWACLR